MMQPQDRFNQESMSFLWFANRNEFGVVGELV